MFEERDLTTEEYRALRESVGWYPMSDEVLAAGLANSLYSVVLVEDDKTVGCGRVVGDGIDGRNRCGALLPPVWIHRAPTRFARHAPDLQVVGMHLLRQRWS
jgi:hypothetical protein